MKRVLISLLCAVLLASCASTTSPKTTVVYDEHGRPWMTGSGEASSLRLQPPTTPMTPPTQDPNAPRMNAAEIAHANALIQRRTTPTTPPPQSGVSGWDVLGAAILFPLLLPVAMITSYPGPGVHCYSYTYKDQYHVKC
jgi:hypothetical protein